MAKKPFVARNLKINTTEISSDRDLSPSINFSNKITGSYPDDGFKVGYDSDDCKAFIHIDECAGFKIHIHHKDRFVISDKGNIGIGRQPSNCLLHVGGSLGLQYKGIEDSLYTIGIKDCIIGVEKVKHNKVEILIPNSQNTKGRVLIIKDEEGQASQYPIVVKATSPATINKKIAMTIQDDYGSLTIYCNGSNWFKI
jgi:hypothetical protein